MKVYLDLVVLLNFLVDFLLLLGTNRLSGFPPAFLRCALGALLGGLYSGVCLVPGFRFLGDPVWRLVSLAAMAAAVFGCDRSAFRRGTIFLLLSMSLGGIAMNLGRGDFLSVCLSAGLVLALCRLSFGDTLGGRDYVPVTLGFRDCSVTIRALRDSGNTLRDPVSGEQILVISAPVACRLTGLSEQQLRNPLDTLAQRPLPGLRLVPFRSVGGTGMLLAMRFDHVKIGSRTQSAIVAFAPEDLGKGEMYQALTGGAL